MRSVVNRLFVVVSLVRVDISDNYCFSVLVCIC